MKNILCTTLFGLTLLLVVACGQNNSASAEQWLVPQLKYPFAVINKGTQEGEKIIKTYDCDSKVIIYTKSYASSVIPFQTTTDFNICGGVK